MSSFFAWAIGIAVLAGLGALVALAIRAYASGTTPGALLFKTKSDPRLSVVEHANVDGRRKLMLIRRDDVEHLIMTGGPVDVVIETGIGEKRARPVEASQTATVFTRPPRVLGQSGSGE